MAISFVNAASADSGTGAGISAVAPAKPTNTASGDLLVAVVAVAGGTGATITPADTWNLLLNPNATTTIQWAFYWRRAGGSEPSTYSFGFDTTRRCAATVAAYRGASFETFTAAATSSAITPNTVTTGAANDWAIYLLGVRSTTGQVVYTIDGGTNGRSQTTNTAAASPWFATLIADETKATAGTTTARTFVPSSVAAARADTYVLAATKTVTGSAALSGTGTVAATGSHTALGSSALAGTGTAAATGVRTRFAAPAITGTGAVAATGVRARFGSSPLAGAGAIAATGVRIRLGAPALAGTGVIAASGVRTRFGAGALAGSGAVAASGAPRVNGAAALNASGLLAASGGVVRIGQAGLIGTGVIAADGELSIAGAAALVGTGTVRARGQGAEWAQGSDLPWIDHQGTAWPDGAEDEWLVGVGAAWPQDTDEEW